MRAFPESLKSLVIWLVVTTGVFLAFQYIQQREQATRVQIVTDGANPVISIRRDHDGHYRLPGLVNGVEVEFMIDTGATHSAVSRKVARSAGLKTVGATRAFTAAGPVEAEVALADLSLEGGLMAGRLRVTVLPDLGAEGLLGMDVLGKLRVEQVNGVLRLSAAEKPPQP
jgi:aspartyl protease family protein